MSDSKHSKKHFMDDRRKNRQGKQQDDRVGHAENFNWRQAVQQVGSEEKKG